MMLRLTLVTLTFAAVALAQNCPPGTFQVVDEDYDECNKRCATRINTALDIFARSECSTNAHYDSPDGVACHECAMELEIWTVVFIFITWLAAVTILVFLLPMCIATCTSCITVRKDAKQKKKVNSQMNSMEVAKAQPAYNPYAYWPYYGRN